MTAAVTSVAASPEIVIAIADVPGRPAPSEQAIELTCPQNHTCQYLVPAAGKRGE